ncbi:hypothetical protein EUZ85_08010 [Hahella sp. KA22]|uniref:hypothetical protein n=1 Tax=Hahella sp. KA22 TaxID=1628392 RepID=UPI000FDD1122|nr:hypothetical protein [Hahella sp. KA22]AZZ90665.1 hypothetical protein ENC22_05460 [Hahella sp. KA22]QAY54035.1 hypothetical protein EUZ85_08010 [Hahella sp. KA22]
MRDIQMLCYKNMTDQRCDNLINEYPEIDFGSLRVYGIATGDITQNYGWGEKYEFKTNPNPTKGVMCSSLLRGYVSHYKLLNNGTLILECFEYPLDKNQKPDIVNEELEGNFWVVMKERFRGERTYVPFRSGKVVSNKSEWVNEKR